jgi:predicted metal-dependent peptidase
VPDNTGPYVHRGTPAIQRMVEYAPATGSLALWIRHRDVDAAEQAIHASNDGLTISYAPGFDRLSLPRQTGLVAHQVLHVALRHAPRFVALRRQIGDIDLELFNICADAIVNSALRHLSWLQLHPKAVLLEDLLNKALGIQQDAAGALLEWDVERLYRAIDDRRPTASSRRGRGRDRRDEQVNTASSEESTDSPRPGRRIDGVRAARVRSLGRHDTRDLVPNETAEDPESAAQSAREWRERLVRGHAGDGVHSMLRGLLADLPNVKTPWEQLLRTRLARGLSQQRALSWSRPARSYVANQGRMRNGRRMPWEPGWSSSKAVARLAVMIDVSGSIDDELLARFGRELAAITRRQEARAVIIIGDDRVREVVVFEPGRIDLGDIRYPGGGLTDFSPLLAEADGWSPDIGVFFTDLGGPAAYRPSFPVIWAVTEPNAHLEHPFGTRLVLD